MRKRFLGWYFKQQNATQTIAIIPAFHTDKSGITTASIQVITQDCAYNIPYLAEDCRITKNSLPITIGNNCFSEQGMLLDINTPDLTLSGELTYKSPTPLPSDIMGVFRYAPFMECRHTVVSMAHKVSGKLMLNGEQFSFNNDIGYIEGDRGCSFPRKYLWTQGSQASTSVMLSVAEIPYLRVRFTGIIAAVYYNETHYRLATYNGARIISLSGDKVIIKQGKLRLSVSLLEKNELPLKAPTSGSMTRIIKESAACKVRFRLEKAGEVIFDFTTDKAGFEYEY